MLCIYDHDSTQIGRLSAREETQFSGLKYTYMSVYPLHYC